MNPFHPFPILANGRLMFQFFSGYWILRNLHETCGHCLPQTLEHQGLAEYPWTCGGLGSTSTARAGLQSLEWRYPLVIQHSYRKLPFIVDLPSKHCDFPVRKVLVYQRVYPLAIKQTMENHLHWGDVPLQRLISIAMIYYWRARSTISECLVISWFRYACSISQFASASHVSVLLVLLATEKKPMISSHVWLVKVKFADDIHILDHLWPVKGCQFVVGFMCVVSKIHHICCWIPCSCCLNPICWPVFIMVHPIFCLLVNCCFFSLGLQGFYETDVSWLYINILYIYINPCKPFVLPLLNISLTILKCVPFNHLQ